MNTIEILTLLLVVILGKKHNHKVNQRKVPEGKENDMTADLALDAVKMHV